MKGPTLLNGEQLAQIKNILFDLDGTLLNIEMNTFVANYVAGLANCFVDLTNRRDFTVAVLHSAFDMLRSNDESQTNEEYFLSLISLRLNIGPALFKTRLEEFYSNGLQCLAPMVQAFPLSRRILQHCFDHDLRVIIATNPLFPRPVIEARLKWADLNEFPFHLVTSYENCRFCKPHPRFFQDILLSQNLKPEESLMVGNDPQFDLAAAEAGIATFLLDPLSSHVDKTFHADFSGCHQDLLHLIESITENRSKH